MPVSTYVRVTYLNSADISYPTVVERIKAPSQFDSIQELFNPFFLFLVFFWEVREEKGRERKEGKMGKMSFAFDSSKARCKGKGIGEVSK